METDAADRLMNLGAIEDERCAPCDEPVGVGERQEYGCFSALEQPQRFDRDPRLVGEGLREGDLPVENWSDLHSAVSDYPIGRPARNVVASVVAMASCFRDAAQRVLAGHHHEIVGT